METEINLGVEGGEMEMEVEVGSSYLHLHLYLHSSLPHAPIPISDTRVHSR